MFVVQRNTLHPTQTRTAVANGRSGATSRQRGGAAAGFSAAMAVSAGRGGSQINGTRPATVENSSPPDPAVNPGLQKLLDTMNALGMSTSGLNINYTEEEVGYPGGTYTNRLINVTSDGKTEHFSSELTAKNPLVTAYELQKYFHVVANPSGASGSITQR